MDVVDDQQLKLIKRWRKHPWNWVTGKDTDGRPLIWTKDERAEKHPIKPFPADLEYLHYYFELLWDEKFVLVDKSRQMIITTGTLLFMDWHCRFRDARRWLLSKHKEDESKELIEDKIRGVHRRLPEWVRNALPISDRPMKKVKYELTDSYILGVNTAVASGEARGGTASGVFVDEAARQPFFKQLYAAAEPMCDRFIAVSTAEFGTPAAAEFVRLRDEGKAKPRVKEDLGHVIQGR